MTIKCPDCHRKNTTTKTSGKIKCKGCLQYIIIDKKKPLCCVPKTIFD